MKTKILITSLLCAAMTTSLLAQHAQPTRSAPAPPRAPVEVQEVPGVTTTATIPGSVPRWRVVGGQNGQQNEMAAALSELKKSESEADRGKAIEKLRELLDSQYDKSLDDYDNYLADMEQRIKEMRTQVEKRRDAKADLVDLRLKMLVNEADGLGWPEGRQNGLFPGSFGVRGFDQGGSFSIPRYNPAGQNTPYLVPRTDPDAVADPFGETEDEGGR